VEYREFLQSKSIRAAECGIIVAPERVNPILFPFQKDQVIWACRKGRAAIFDECGLGKTFIQLEWARLIGGRSIIVAPLSVARQTVREAAKLGITAHYTRSGDDLINGINITNYEMIEHFDPLDFEAVVLDESSILKGMSSHTKRTLTEMFKNTPYRLCCTATPAPNDHVELGNHAEFLGICTEPEMRAMFFINANKEHTIVLDNKTYTKKGSNKNGTEWRLKHAGEVPFYHWLASWATVLTKPSDLGYSDDGFILPELTITPQFVEGHGAPDGQLFFTHLKGIADRSSIRRKTIDARLDALKALLADNDDQWIIWVGLDEEGRTVRNAIAEVVEVKGADSPEYKAETFEAFQDGKFRLLLTKGRIGGFGMNFQNAHRMVFFGLNDSWETWYQCIRREWRFRQEHPVDVHIILSDYEAEIYANIMRKDAMATRLRRGLVDQIRTYEEQELAMANEKIETVENRIVKGENWTALQGDSCERLKEINSNSVDLSVYSPPFADLFTYTDSPRDLGNSRDWSEFFDHYKYIIREVLRVTKPGRLTCIHTSDIPAMLERDGYIGVRDFPGAVIRAYETEGWIFQGRAFVQKNPQAQAIRVKSKALLFVQLRKDSTDSRPALIDQVLFFCKPGENAIPVSPVANGEMDNETWIEWAHGIWIGIRETETLQAAGGRGIEDEKHICPLQLGTIERCIKLYSNPGETVLTPFLGIGSEAYQAIKLGRKAVGIELKESYFDAAVKNLQNAERESSRQTLWSLMQDQDSAS
jgi:DNA modification methylase